MISPLKKLSIDMIEGCVEINAWLDQFPANKRTTAIDLLLKLRFVTRDIYSEWLKSTLSDMTQAPCALYAVRKFNHSDINCIWDELGKVVGRPSTSLGSEDLVHSVISQIKKDDQL